MADSDSSQLSSGPASPEPTADPVAATPANERPSANRFDTMFGSDDENDNEIKEEEQDDDHHQPAPEHNDSDDDEGAAGTRRRERILRVQTSGHDNDDQNSEDGHGGGDDLFGDDSDADEGLRRPAQTGLEDTPPPASRTPSPEKEETYVDVSIPLHPGPVPGPDGELYLMKTAALSLPPQLFYPEKFELPKSTTGASAYTSATSAIRVRPTPGGTPGELQSNARIIRWSDGTLSLQVASSPNMLDLPCKTLAPVATAGARAYKPEQDSHTYLLDPIISAGFLRVCGQATSSLGCQPAAGSIKNDTAVELLASRLRNPRGADAKQRTREMDELIDPEAQRKAQEMIARQKERDTRKKEQLRRKREDREPSGDAGMGRRERWRGSGTRSKRDSPPITMGRGKREDEYDLEDGFIEGSGSEEEVVSSEESEEERVVRKKNRGEERAGKRRRIVDESDEEE